MRASLVRRRRDEDVLGLQGEVVLLEGAPKVPLVRATNSPLLLPHSPNFHLAPRSLSSHQLSPPHCTGKHTRSGAGAESPTRPQPTALPSGRFTLATKEDSELLLMTSPTRLSLRQHGPAPKHLLRPSATSLGCTASVRCRAER